MRLSQATYTVMLVCLMLLVQACREEEHPIPMMSGLLLTLEEDAATVETRSAPSELYVPVAKNFTVRIVKDGTGSVAYDRAYTNQSIPLSAGDYTLTASYGSDVAIGLDAPYYEGSTSATVEKDQVTPVTIRCGVANALVSVKYVDGNTKQESLERFDRFFSSYDVRVQVGNNSLLLPHDTKQSVYFPAGSTPSLQFKGTLKDHADRAVSYSFPTEQIPAFEAGTHAIFYLSVAPLEEGVGLYIEKVEVKQERISETVPMEWLPKPWVTPIGFTDETMTHYETEEVPTTQLLFNAAVGLQEVKFTVAFDDVSYSSLNGEYILSEMTEAQKEAFADAGIILPVIGDPSRNIMDFTALIPQLTGDPTTTVPSVNNTVTLTYIKANDKEADAEELKGYTLAIKAKPVFTMPALNEGKIWSKSFTSEDAIVTAGYAAEIMEGIGYEYSLDNGYTWYPYSKENSDKKSHHFGANRPASNAKKGEAEGTVHVWVRAKYRGFTSNKTTFDLEFPVQIPNSDMDEWTDSTRDVKIIWGDTKQQPIYYPWVTGGEEQYWDTNNNESMLQRVSAAYLDYKCFPTTCHTTGRTGSGKAAVIRSVATNSSNSLISGAGRKRGILYIGTTDYDGNRTEGKDFPSRPTSLTFYYKYDSYDNERFGAYIELYNGSNAIASGSYTSTNGVSIGSYAQCSVPLTFSNTTLKATSIRVRFYSVADGDDPATRRVDVTIPKGEYNIWGGSVLTIDDISLVYDK